MAVEDVVVLTGIDPTTSTDAITITDVEDADADIGEAADAEETGGEITVEVSYNRIGLNNYIYSTL